MKKYKTGVKAEWHKAKTILMHEPGLEAELMAHHYPSALYERSVNVDDAKKQHQFFVNILKKEGIEVILVRDVLRKKTDINKLRELAKMQLKYAKRKINKYDQEKIKDETINNCGRDQLVNIILLNPNISWSGDDKNGLCEDAIRIYRPIGNLLFTRDQMITTKKGIVLSRMRSHQREIEVDIMRVVLESLGINPIYNVKKRNNESYLEGGDFYPMDKFCLLGLGSRTGYDGAMQLLENNVFGTEEVILVKDKVSDQSTMHLDTYFNVLKKDLVVMLGDRLEKGRIPLIERWYKEGGKYKLDKKTKNMPFNQYLEEKGVRIIGIPKSMQLKYNLNFLNLGRETITGILKDNKNGKEIKNLVTWLNVPYREINNMYGGHHCTTQVLFRE